LRHGLNVHHASRGQQAGQRSFYRFNMINTSSRVDASHQGMNAMVLKVLDHRFWYFSILNFKHEIKEKKPLTFL
jgi:hypothetical protein